MITDIKRKLNSFGVHLKEDFNLDHLYCVDHKIQLTAKLACDDKHLGFDAADNPCCLIQNCKANIGQYRSSA
jgi:hypothetical protein